MNANDPRDPHPAPAEADRTAAEAGPIAEDPSRTGRIVAGASPERRQASDALGQVVIEADAAAPSSIETRADGAPAAVDLGPRAPAPRAALTADDEPPSESTARAVPPHVDVFRAPPEVSIFERIRLFVRDYFVGEDPSFWVAMLPFLALSALLYSRNPATNFIFDEQEALLANPYVHGKNLGWLAAFRRDFWGLPPDRSVGSYRPIPDLLWRAFWHVSESPWFHQWVNVFLHAANGACLTMFVFLTTRRRGLSWLVGAIFVGCAVLTEAVAGVVGIADVLGGMGAILGLLALRLPLWAMPAGVALSVLFGLFSKESALVCVPLIPYAALLLAPVDHPARPLRALRAGSALLASGCAFVLYIELRKRLFPAPVDVGLAEPLAGGSSLARAGHAFLEWMHQPSLPKDPLNNPLIKADAPHRIAGALRVYWRGLTQIVFPRTLSGDYSFPQEPIPDRLVFPESVLGGLAMVVPPILSIGLWASTLWRPADRETTKGHDAPPVPAGPEGLGSASPRAASADAPLLLVALGLMWVVVSYFPHSNIPALLPTVRAERFWYFPAIGSSLVLGVGFAWLYARTRHVVDGAPAAGLFALFFVFQCGRAFTHTTDYRDDLTFWDATRHAVPRSAKAHLNYSVMQGARGRLDIRLVSNEVALGLAPEWPMAHVYLGDTLCRMHRVNEAWPHYETGLDLAAGDPNLVALALQCLWDETVASDDPDHPPDRAFYLHSAELEKLAEDHTGSWLAYLVRDMQSNAEKNNGVEPKYRPRGYNEGPKD